jgi:hypothetical protein
MLSFQSRYYWFVSGMCAFVDGTSWLLSDRSTVPLLLYLHILSLIAASKYSDMCRYRINSMKLMVGFRTQKVKAILLKRTATQLKLYETESYVCTIISLRNRLLACAILQSQI